MNGRGLGMIQKYTVFPYYHAECCLEGFARLRNLYISAERWLKKSPDSRQREACQTNEGCSENCRWAETSSSSSSYIMVAHCSADGGLLTLAFSWFKVTPGCSETSQTVILLAFCFSTTGLTVDFCFSRWFYDLFLAWLPTTTPSLRSLKSMQLYKHVLLRSDCDEASTTLESHYNDWKLFWTDGLSFVLTWSLLHFKAM